MITSKENKADCNFAKLLQGDDVEFLVICCSCHLKVNFRQKQPLEDGQAKKQKWNYFLAAVKMQSEAKLSKALSEDMGQNPFVLTTHWIQLCICLIFLKCSTLFYQL